MAATTGQQQIAENVTESLNQSNGASYLPQVLEKANQLNQIVSTRMRDFKNIGSLIAKLNLLAETLKGAETSPLKNESFYSNLTEVSTTLDLIIY